MTGALVGLVVLAGLACWAVWFLVRLGKRQQYADALRDDNEIRKEARDARFNLDDDERLRLRGKYQRDK